MRILHLAAFPDGTGGGNPAAVVLTAEPVPAAEALALAARIGYSETAFVSAPDAAGDLPVRYFSPAAEVAFCGHATIALAVALAERDGPGLRHLSTLAGRIPVRTTRSGGSIWATLTSPAATSVPAGAGEIAAALAALRWAPADLDATLPVHVASAGERHLIVPAASRERLADLDYDFPALRDLMTAQGWTTVHLTWRERDDLWHARDPFPVGGVVEDPATGAAAAAFGGYLRSLRLVPIPFSFVILQGADMGRPSRLRVDLDDDTPGVGVSGTAVRLPPSPS